MGDPIYFLKRQSLWLGVGMLACVIGARRSITSSGSGLGWIWFAASAILLALCFVPHVGLRINGARRWVDFRVLTFQPSDFAKIAAIAFLAHWYSKYEEESGTFLRGFAGADCDHRRFDGIDRAGDRYGHHGIDRRDDVRDDVCRGEQL